MINLDELPRETRTVLEMKEERDTTFERCLTEDFSEDIIKTIEERKDPRRQQSFIFSTYGLQGSGKSYLSLSILGLLDDDFSEDKLYFGYEELVKNRRNLKSGTSVIVDEMMNLYGVDSHRISIYLDALKEQLRKRSIHMGYCSPTLKPEYHTSMRVFETLFIDKKTEMCYAAYKTNELINLGYVKIPHPKKVVGKEFLKIYEDKKDKHLENLTDKSIDELKIIVDEIFLNEKFINIEKVYLQKRGFIPTSMLFQLVSMLYPEFKGSIIVTEIVDRIKLMKETSGEWVIWGSKAREKGEKKEKKKEEKQKATK